MKYLTILFLIGGEWTLQDGWHPRLVDDCEARAETVRAYLDEWAEYPAKVECV